MCRAAAQQLTPTSAPSRRILKLNYELRARIYSRVGGDSGVETWKGRFETLRLAVTSSAGELAADAPRERPTSPGGKRLRNDSLTRRPLNSSLVFLVHEQASPHTGPSAARAIQRDPAGKVRRELLLSAGILSHCCGLSWILLAKERTLDSRFAYAGPIPPKM